MNILMSYFDKHFDGELEPSQKCHKAAIAILLSAISELCILHHICGIQHDTREMVMFTPMFWWSRITMIPYTTS